MKKISLITFLLPTTLAFAATQYTWNGNVGLWNVQANWVPATSYPQLVDDAALFTSTSIALNQVINLTGANALVGIMQFNSGTYTYVIESNPIGSSLTFQSNNASAQITSSGSQSYTIATPVILNSNLSISQSSSANFVISGIISGAKSITIGGSGLTQFSGTNTYSLGTTLNSGTLQVSQDSNLGTGNLFLNAGTLNFAGGSYTSSKSITLTGLPAISVTGGGEIQLTGLVKGSGGLNVTGTDILFLNNSANSFTNGITLTSGTLKVSNNASLGDPNGSLNFAGGTLEAAQSFTLARSGTITTIGTIDSKNYDLTLNGVLSGSGSLTIQSTAMPNGTVKLIGTNTYSGGTDVTSTGTLLGNSTSIQGNVTVDGKLKFIQTTTQNSQTTPLNGVFAGNVSGAGDIYIEQDTTQTGLISFTGDGSSFTGNVYVDAPLFINGDFSASTFSVLSTGTLSGTGTVGTSDVTGTIAPGVGSGTDTLTVNGTLSFQMGSKMEFTVTPDNADKIHVTGTCDLQNSSLVINPIQGFYPITNTRTVVIADGGFSNCCPTGTSLNPNFVITSIFEDMNNLEIEFKALNPFYDFPFSNKNTQNVGNAIAEILIDNQASSDFENVINSFVGQSNLTINNALNKIHPGAFGAISELQSEVTSHIVNFFQRSSRLSCSCNEEGRIWFQPFGNHISMKNQKMKKYYTLLDTNTSDGTSSSQEIIPSIWQRGFNSNTLGFAFGIDQEVSERFALGIGASANYTYLKWAGSYGNIDTKSLYGCIYSDYKRENFYLGATILAGIDLYKSSRHLDFTNINRHAHAKFHGLDVVSRISMSYLFGSQSGQFYPYSTFDFLYLHTNSFKEKNAQSLNLKIRPRTISTLRSELGFGLDVIDANEDETICIAPKVKVGWVNMYPIERETFHSNFENTTIMFESYGWDYTWNLLKAELGLKFTFGCTSLSFNYDIEISLDKKSMLQNQFGLVNLEFNW